MLKLQTICTKQLAEILKKKHFKINTNTHLHEIYQVLNSYALLNELDYNKKENNKKDEKARKGNKKTKSFDI